MRTLRRFTALAIGATLVLSSCNKEDDNLQNSDSPNQPSQSMKVRMTDNPGNYEALDVEVTSVSAYNSDLGEWVELNGNTQTVSVLELTNGEETQLAYKSEIEAGLYTQLKIEFSQNNELTLNSFASAGTSSSTIAIGVNVGLSSTVNETVIIQINEQVSSSSSANILVDFNVMESVVETGNSYILDPHLTIIEDESTGVQGSVENDTRAALEFDLDGNMSTSYTAYTNEDGEFMIRGMADGNYNLTIMPDQDESPSLNSSYTYSGVVVVDGEITSMGEIDLQ